MQLPIISSTVFSKSYVSEINKTRPFLKEGKLELLQIFRGLAAIIVVLHHITASNLFYLKFSFLNGVFVAGWNGVDFFFVLSGFIITYIHFKDLGNRQKVYTYAVKRLIRIYPIYLFFALIALAFYLFSLPNGNYNLSYIVKCLLLIPQNETTILGVSWSLCFEILFYIIFSLYILGGYKTFIFGLIVHFLLVIANEIKPELFHEMPFLPFASNNFNLEFLIGCSTAILLVKAKRRFLNKYSLFLLFCGLIIFLLTWNMSLINESFGKQSFNCRVFYGISSALIILGSALLTNIGNSFIVRLLLKVGDASYVLYLAHPIILALTFKMLMYLIAKYSFSHSSYFLYCFNLAILIICVLSSLFLSKYLEKPLLRKLNLILIKR